MRPGIAPLLSALLLLSGCQHCPTTLLPAPPARPIVAQQAPPADHAALKILTWNIWMMPAFTFQSPLNTRRAAAIAASLEELDYDIICFEKAFDGAARAVLSKALGMRYPHRYGPANSGFSLKVNSGVWVFSRFPLTVVREIQFRDCAGIECLSRKGAMLLEGAFEGHAFQIVAAHLQGEAGNIFTEAHQQVRNRQMAQIRDELLTPHTKSGVPLFLCGDFDTPRSSGGYQVMLKIFGDPGNGAESRITLVDDCAVNDLAMGNHGRRDELDYILVRSGGAALDAEWHLRPLRSYGWDGRTTRKDLSYRYAVEAFIRFR
jgi:endonuclease/exonuclease/phosphatase family metal-dependent hydrolase